MKRWVTTVLAAALAVSLLGGCSSGGSQKKELLFANAGWDSIQFHNAVAGFIAETAFGYQKWDNVTGSTPVMHEGLLKGEVDVHMEIWTDNIASYQEDLAANRFREMGINFDAPAGGFYVPRYVIEGDAARGLKALAPDLKTVADLLKYKELFPDDEKAGRSRIYGAIPGWEADTIHYAKYSHHGLDAAFEYFRPGSDAALAAAYTAAYTKGEPIVGYYWEPTWLMGKYDFVRLEEQAYTNKEDYWKGACRGPEMHVTVAVSNKFAEKDPEFCAFLQKYHTTSKMTGEALAYMQETGASHLEAAKWFLQQNDELLEQFLTAEQAQMVRNALK